MYSNKLYTPLRYPGGKARFAPLITEVISANNLTGGHYLEPYAGGAGVALSLLVDGVVEHVHINDADRRVLACRYAEDEPIGSHGRLGVDHHGCMAPLAECHAGA